MPKTSGVLVGGVYTLRQDVVNPCVDRRNKNDWYKQPVFKAGTLFIVYQLPFRQPELQVEHYNEIKLVQGGLRISEHGDMGNKIFPALVPHLELLKPEEYTIGLIVKVMGDSMCLSGSEVLGVLVDKGVISVRQVYDIVKEMDEWTEDQFSQLLRRHNL
jgi:hypothetical protein